jgi:hypothetical protein
MDSLVAGVLALPSLQVLEGKGLKLNDNELTVDQKAANYETCRHVEQVRRFLTLFVKELLDRANEHDQSKLEHPEVEMFTEFAPKLAASTYGSPEYEGFRKAMGPALAHHYAKNRHHPEHFKDGVEDMNLLDLVEMFCDWKAATMRHNDGNLRKSIQVNAKRFDFTRQLERIFENTADLVDGK